MLSKSRTFDDSDTGEQGFLHTRIVANTNMTVATSVSTSSGGTAQDLMFPEVSLSSGTNNTKRYSMAGSTANTFPTVFKKNSNEYSEAAVWNILNEAAIIVAGLKLGKWDSSTQITRTATSGTVLI